LKTTKFPLAARNEKISKFTNPLNKSAKFESKLKCIKLGLNLAENLAEYLFSKNYLENSSETDVMF